MLKGHIAEEFAFLGVGGMEPWGVWSILPVSAFPSPLPNIYKKTIIRKFIRNL